MSFWNFPTVLGQYNDAMRQGVFLANALYVWHHTNTHYHIMKAESMHMTHVFSSEPHAGFKIAFNMFDADSNQMVDKQEFLVVR